jgi:hypothetical protein
MPFFKGLNLFKLYVIGGQNINRLSDADGDSDGQKYSVFKANQRFIAVFIRAQLSATS